MFADGRIVQQGQNYYVQHGDDKNLYVEFTLEPIKNEARSIEEGRPIYDDVEYITIRIAGDTKTVRKRPVKTEWEGDVPPDSLRWQRQYEAFKKGIAQTVEGTPLEEWPQMTRSDVRSLREMNIHTVEQLAALGDNNMTWFGARTWVEKAKSYLAQAKDGSGLVKLQAENDHLKNEIEALKQQIAAIAEIKEVEKKKGRPVKNGEDVS